MVQPKTKTTSNKLVQFSSIKCKIHEIEKEMPDIEDNFGEPSILLIKFIYSEKATKFCEIVPLLLTTVHTVKSKGKISQNFVAFSEYHSGTWTENN